MRKPGEPTGRTEIDSVDPAPPNAASNASAPANGTAASATASIGRSRRRPRPDEHRRGSSTPTINAAGSSGRSAKPSALARPARQHEGVGHRAEQRRDTGQNAEDPVAGAAGPAPGSSGSAESAFGRRPPRPCVAPAGRNDQREIATRRRSGRGTGRAIDAARSPRTRTPGPAGQPRPARPRPRAASPWSTRSRPW